LLEPITHRTPCRRAELAAMLGGRLIFGACFVYNAFSHYKNVGSMSAYAASNGVPAPKAASWVRRR
jgi:hypothetical protein